MDGPLLVLLAAEHAMRDALRRAVAAGSTAEARAQVNTSVARLASAGLSDGTVDPSVRAEDMTVVLAGVVAAAAVSEDKDQLRRVIKLLVRGLKA